MVNIYKLLDPDTLKIRYVGKTIEPLNRRLCKHMYNRNNKSKIAKWCRKLHRENKRPIIELIEEVRDSIWGEKEKYWIKYYKDKGCDLMNLLPGGENEQQSYQHTEEAKQKISKANKRPKSKEWMENAAEAMRKVRCKTILKLDKENNILDKYDSFPEAAKDVWSHNYQSAVKNIHACCNYKRKTAYGFVWRYENVESEDKELQR